MAPETADQLLFENAEWALTEGGLGHKRTGYFIEREALASRRSDGLWTWPLQMAEKLWCAPALFVEAFLRALRVCAIEPDPALALSLAALGSGGAGSARSGTALGPQSEAAFRLGDLVDLSPAWDPARAARAVAAPPARSLRRPGASTAPAVRRTKVEPHTWESTDESRAAARARALGMGSARRAARR